MDGWFPNAHFNIVYVKGELLVVVGFWLVTGSDIHLPALTLMPTFLSSDFILKRRGAPQPCLRGGMVKVLLRLVHVAGGHWVCQFT